MSRFLSAALAMTTFVVLTSFALSRPSPTPTKDGPAWTVSDYRLDRAFRISGNLPNQTLQVPAGGGCIITQIRVGTNYSVTIGVNGTTETFGSTGSNYIQSGPSFHTLNPPLILRPGDVFAYTPSLSQAGTPADVTIAGFSTYPGET